MDYKEEQEQELEVLQSIYPDELTIVNDKYPNISFEILLPLELNQLDDPIIDSLTNVHTLLVQLSLPESYPDETPMISIDCQMETITNSYNNNSEDDDDDDDYEEQGGDDDEAEDEFDDHGNKIISKLENIPNSIRFDEFIPILINDRINNDEYLENEMMVMKGMQMCFTLISSIKEQCENWFLKELQSKELKHEKELELKEKLENAKFVGTKVTKDSYLEWRNNFRKEMKLDERDKDRRLKAHHGKLTGRLMFEQGIAGTEDDDVDLDDQTTDTLAKNVDTLKI